MGRRARSWTVATLAVVTLAVVTLGCAPSDDVGTPSRDRVDGDVLSRPIHHPFRDSDIGLTLARYDVRDGELVAPRVSAAVPDELLELRDDRARHREAWSLWLGLAPAPWRDDIGQLLIATDGTDGIMASVGPVDAQLSAWVLHIDPAELDDQEELEETLVHELAHVLSLRRGQVLVTPSVAWGFGSLAEAADACAPGVGIEDGCLDPEAYLSRFIARFWDAELLAAADAIAVSETPERDALALFDQDPSRFATDYAASHPAEDFAESWVTFVLYEYEGVDEPWARKAAFFEGFPELVEARAHIWQLLDLGP